MMKRLRVAVVFVLFMFLLSGCVAGTGHFTDSDPAGFFSGVLHGWIAPFILIGKLFGLEVNIYEFNNSGILYDIGFYIAIVGGVGSFSFTRRKNNSSND